MGFKSFVKGVGNFLGVTGPDTGGIDREKAEFAKMRQQFAGEYGNTLAPRDVTAAHGNITRVGPIERATAAGQTSVDTVNAPSIGRMPTATAGQIARPDMVDAARIAPAAQAQAQQASAAGAGRTVMTVGGNGGATQGAAADMVMRRAQGLGPSVAEISLRNSINDINNQQRSIAAGARGSGIGAARRRAAREISLQQGNAASAAALGKAQETIAAQNTLAGLSTEMRGQDIGVASTQANLDQTRNLANAQNETQTSIANAGLGTNVGISNAEAVNRRATTQAGFEQEAGQAHAGRVLARDTAQAGHDTNVSVSDADREAKGILTGADMNLQAQTTNAGAVNRARESAADRSTTVSVRNADAQNSANEADAARDQSGSQFNATQTNTVAQNNEDRRLNERQSLRGDTMEAGRAVLDAEGTALGAREAGKARRTELVTNLAKSGAAAIAASDKDTKKNIGNTVNPDMVRSFLRAVDPATFEYKNPNTPVTAPGKKTGVLLDKPQGLEDTAMGKSFIENGPAGFQMNAAQAVGPMLVALKYLNDKIDAKAKNRRAGARALKA